MKKALLLVFVLLVLCTSSFAYYLRVRAFEYPFEFNQVEINARIYIDDVYTGYLTPHTFDPYVGGVYTVQHDDYTEWVPESALVEEIPASGTIIFGTYPDEELPVELSYFNATISANNYVNIQWVTQSETGAQGFYILRNTQDDLTSAEVISSQITATNTTNKPYVYQDTELYEDGTYYYWLQSLDFDGTTYFNGPTFVYYTGTIVETPVIPLVTKLNAIYPNPFNPLAFIPYSIALKTDVSIEILNTRGQIVKHLDLGTKNPGHYQTEWSGTDDNGRELSNGVYYLRMLTNGESQMRKAVLLK